MKNILITGASGFVGSRILQRFLENQDRVIGIGTSKTHPLANGYPGFEWVSADTTQKGDWQKHARDADIIINLTGRNIFKYWTKKYKQAIYDSRILTTRNIVSALDGNKDQVLLNASAVGIYGDRQDEALPEQTVSGEGFLADVCTDWESEAFKAEEKGARVAVMRFGVVLGKGGALEKMLPAFKFFVGGPLGSGQHWFPWIHISDLERAVFHIIENETLDGVLNFVSPVPVRHAEFADALGRALNRPSFFPVPGFGLKLLMGELGAALLQSQKGIPKALLEGGFVFEFKDIDGALNNLVSN